MKIWAKIIGAGLLFFSCKKAAQPAQDSLSQQLKGKWKLVSETRSGNYDNSRYAGVYDEGVEYKDDGNVYSSIQGQAGATYAYDLNGADKTIRFFFVDTHPTFLVANPCSATTGPACVRPAKIQYLSSDLLVIGNSFTGTVNGSTYTTTIVDSLTR